jgi:magnesium chelatase subunit D
VLDHGRDKRVSGAGAPSFDGIVGQGGLKEALLAVAADDGLDGLLVRGEKGTAKSTAVRALAGLVPPRREVADCPYGCPPDDPARACSDCRGRVDPPTVERPPPLVTLPLGATRERVVGSLSVTDALEGEPSFEPGLLARANRGLLYVDEVNLLDDHLVDLLLDAAASGLNRVERDGVSVVHPAEFTLVGTMNPEEGDLRPQLRDRFALSTTVTACEGLDDRVRIVERALGEADPAPTGDDHAARLREARARVDGVEVPREFVERIAGCCRDAGVDGHRADVAATRAARAVAALDGRGRALESDARRGLELALPHRLRADPFDDAPDLDDLLEEWFGEADDDGTDDAAGEADGDGGETGRDGTDDATDEADGDGGETGRGGEGRADDDRGDGAAGGAGAEAAAEEIGRASCRERVYSGV